MTSLLVDRRGDVLCLYDEGIDLSSIGDLQIRRASYVEPDSLGRWWADLSPVCGPRMGPFSLRSEALAGEWNWLSQNLQRIGQAGASPGAGRPGPLLDNYIPINSEADPWERTSPSPLRS